MSCYTCVFLFTQLFLFVFDFSVLNVLLVSYIQSNWKQRCTKTSLILFILLSFCFWCALLCLVIHMFFCSSFLFIFDLSVLNVLLVSHIQFNLKNRCSKTLLILLILLCFCFWCALLCLVIHVFSFLLFVFIFDSFLLNVLLVFYIQFNWKQRCTKTSLILFILLSFCFWCALLCLVIHMFFLLFVFVYL